MSPSAIEWTDETWNPTVGCSRVSLGCDHCYAIGVAHRAMQPAHVGLTYFNDSGEARWGADWTGEVRCLPERLDIPLRWRRPRRVFVDSMSDLFHQDVPESFIASVWATMAAAERHTFQVLTKRPQRMADLVGRLWQDCNGDVQRNQFTNDELGIRPAEPLPNVWLGTSVENQRYADLRIPHLLRTPAAVRFLSIEPLLGPVDLFEFVRLTENDRPLISWVIVGGESGPGSRPMHPEWVRSIRDQCNEAGIPFFFKQWGSWAPTGPVTTRPHVLAHDGTLYGPHDLDYLDYPDGVRRAEAIRAGHDRAQLTAMYRQNKKLAGRELEGRTWDEMP